MLTYTLKRLLLTLPTLLGVAVAAFVLLRVVPGDVVAAKFRSEGGNVSAHATHLVGSALSDAFLSFSAGRGPSRTAWATPTAARSLP